MAEIINFNETARLKQQLAAKEEELTAAKAELESAREKLGIMVSVNELLRLQIQDLLHTLEGMKQAFETTCNNLKGLQAKLPKF